MLIEYIVTLIILVISATSVYFVISKRRFDAVGGLVFGYAFFVGGPCLQLFLFGKIIDDQIGVPSVKLGESIELIAYLFVGALFSASFLMLPLRRQFRSIGRRIDSLEKIKLYLNAYVLTYLLLAVVLFIMSGKQDGGHWMENNRDMYSQGFLSTIVGNFYNVLRVAFSGVILFSFKKGVVTWKKAIALLVLFSVFELFVSSNRIMVLFALIACSIILWSIRKRYIFLLIFMLPMLLQFNQLFPMVRGLMWSDGINAHQISDSFRVAFEHKSNDKSSFETIFGSSFESSNIMVLQYIMETYGTSDPYLYGETMVIKPITFFLPRTIFPFKPEGFGSRLGYAISGSNVLALNSTLLGEAYGNFGWFGPMAFFLLGALFIWMSKFVGGELFNYQFFFVFFASWRFDYSFMLIAIFVLSIFVISNRIFARVFRARLFSSINSRVVR